MLNVMPTPQISRRPRPRDGPAPPLEVVGSGTGVPVKGLIMMIVFKTKLLSRMPREKKTMAV